jgi:hypothetical protein
VVGTGPTSGNVYVGSLDSSDVKLILGGNSAAVYTPPGYVLFLRESTLMAQRFDLGALSTRGEAVPVAEGVGASFMSITYVVSDNGTLVYRAAVSQQTRLTWVDRTGGHRRAARPPASMRTSVGRRGTARDHGGPQLARIPEEMMDPPPEAIRLF